MIYAVLLYVLLLPFWSPFCPALRSSRTCFWPSSLVHAQLPTAAASVAQRDCSYGPGSFFLPSLLHTLCLINIFWNVYFLNCTIVLINYSCGFVLYHKYYTLQGCMVLAQILLLCSSPLWYWFKIILKESFLVFVTCEVQSPSLSHSLSQINSHSIWENSMGFGPVSVTPGLATHMEVRGPDCKATLKTLEVCKWNKCLRFVILGNFLNF